MLRTSARRTWKTVSTMLAMAILCWLVWGPDATAQRTSRIYRTEGGDRLVVSNGGDIVVEPGGEIIVQAGGAIDVQSNGALTLSEGWIATLEEAAVFEVATGGEIAVQTGGALTIETGGALAVESGGGISIASGGALTVASGGAIAVPSGGAIAVATGGAITVASGGAITVASGGTFRSAANAGVLKTKTGLSLVEHGDGVLHKTLFTLDDVAVTITDHTTAGAHGTQQLYDFPAGFIKLVGSTCDLTVECGTTGLTATATYDVAIGSLTLGIDDAALAGTEQDIITKIEGNLIASAATLVNVNSTDLTLDGHTSAADAFVNVAFEANDASGNDACTITGTVTLTWMNLGDY